MITAIVTDIEGTTSSIRFVKDVLFPYAAEHLPAFVHEHFADEQVKHQLSAVAQMAGLGSEDLDALIRQLLDWIASDTKATPLKALQGMIWKKGYQCGDYRAHFYPDAVEKMTAWHQSGMPLYVYSSGSIQAQKLFFRHSSFGDLRPLISGWFDTTTGPKNDPESYLRIQASISRPAHTILFLSDVPVELDAAAEAGFETIGLARPDDSNPKESETWSGHRVVTSFADIDL